VRQAADIRELASFARFISVSAALTSTKVNTSQLGRDVGVAPATARKWLDILTYTYQWRELGPYHGNTVKRLSGKHKGLMCDSGLVCHLQRISSPEALAASPLLGPVFETWVVNNVHRQFSKLDVQPAAYHWRTAGGAEVDLVLERDGKLYPVEVKCKTKLSRRDTRGLRQAISIVRFESSAPLSKAVIDADGELAMVIPPPSQEELELRRALSDVPSAAVIASLPELVDKVLAMDIKQTLFWGQLGRKLYDWELYEEALAVFGRRAEMLEEMESEWVVSAYGWQGLLLDLLGRREEAVVAYEKALETETDREFSYNGDPVTIQRAWLQERLKTAFERLVK
jgi:hypothetical protein